MDSSGPPAALYYVSSALTCLLYLAGLIAGIVALIRKRNVPGILAIVAFLLLGLNTLTNLILPVTVLPAIMKSNGNYATYGWINFCVNTPLHLLGVISLVILAFTNVGRKVEKTVPEETLPAG